MGLAIVFLLGCVVGGLFTIRYVKVTDVKLPLTVGDLRIVRDEDEPYIFLQLDHDLGVLYNQKEVILKVVMTDVSQN